MNSAETPPPTAPAAPPSSTPSSSTPPGDAPARPAQPRNPLHGVTLEAMVVALSEHFGWKELGQRIPVRCFQSDPSVSSSLKFLRKTPWAREKVESLYLFMLREQRRNGPR
ncbi:MAG: VF530 family protein [Acidovorax sp.]|uniref:VF530 family protein n=1 Tax=Acidovorax sp. TaxID=1872122 RepID=UPI0025BBD106|nr:VF530 family protein [Acidovorax sp.]MCE1193115.1 VF530 family protein [Acidovorax sp.]